MDYTHDQHHDQLIIDQQTIKSMLRKLSIEVTIHGIANAESYAIDLFWDLIARYTHLPSMRKIDVINDEDAGGGDLYEDLSGMTPLRERLRTTRVDVTEYLLPLEFYNGYHCCSNYTPYHYIIVINIIIIFIIFITLQTWYLSSSKRLITSYHGFIALLN
jgi:hypothetical protein